MKELAILTDAVKMLAEAKSLDEIKHIHGLLKVAEAYAKAEKLGMEAEAHAAELRLRAARKAGEALVEAKETGEYGPGGDRKSSYHDGKMIPMSDLGITNHQSSDWQAMANADEEDFEEAVTKAKKKKATSDRAVANMLRKPKKTPKPPDIAEDLAPAESPTEAFEKLYSVIYASPSYETMTTEEIAALPVTLLADENAMLFIWSPATLLADALKIINAWGFTYKTSMVWDKDIFDKGHYTKVQHELLLICQKGSISIPKEKNRPKSIFRPTIYDEVGDKPREIYGIIESMYPDYDKIELFNDKSKPGWDRWISESEEKC